MNNQSLINAVPYMSSNKELASACGLYCGACGIYIATQENDTEKIVQYAVVLNQTFDETLCDGCSAKRKSLHCSRMCTFIDCKAQRGVSDCTDCNEYPCKALKEFRSKMPHRSEIFESLHRMQTTGIENWLIEMKEAFSCPHCKTVNSAYHVSCRNCGGTPSCKFVFRHKDTIEQYLSK